LRPSSILRSGALTLLGWAGLLGQALLVAQSLSPPATASVLVSAFTLSTLVTSLPLAPSGLGTREAALLVLLAPYPVSLAQLGAALGKWLPEASQEPDPEQSGGQVG
jgi:uncharacterized membrane protein YbhN (UPF0104 family)